MHNQHCNCHDCYDGCFCRALSGSQPLESSSAHLCPPVPTGILSQSLCQRFSAWAQWNWFLSALGHPAGPVHEDFASACPLLGPALTSGLIPGILIQDPCPGSLKDPSGKPDYVLVLCGNECSAPGPYLEAGSCHSKNDGELAWISICQNSPRGLPKADCPFQQPESNSCPFHWGAHDFADLADPQREF